MIKIAKNQSKLQEFEKFKITEKPIVRVIKIAYLTPEGFVQEETIRKIHKSIS